MDAFLRAFASRVDRAPSPAEQSQLNEAALDSVRQDMAAAMRESMRAGLAPQPTIDGSDAHPALHPISLAKRVVQKRGLVQNADELAKITEIIEKTYPRDAVTGYYAKQCMPVIVGLAHMQAQAQENHVPVSLVEGDFSNMGGCNNSAVGREGTDKLIHKICELLEQSFADYAKEHGQKVGIVAAQSETHGIRAGGDEVRLVVYGLEPKQIKEVLDTRVHPKINLLAAEFGVHNVKHEKKGKLAGFGAAFGAVDLTRETDTAKIRDMLNTDIEERKRVDGLLRMGVTDAAGVERYMREVYELYLKDQKLVPAAIEGKMRAEFAHMQGEAKAVAETWKAMTQEGSPFPEAYHGVKENPKAFFDALSAKMAPSVKERLGEITLTHVPTLVPFAQEKVEDQGEAPESIRLRKVLNALKFTEIAHAKRPLFEWNTDLRRYDLVRPPNMDPGPERGRTLRLAIDLMQQFDAMDPAARCKAPHLIAEDGRDFMERYKGQGGMKLVQFELGNVNGLNTVNYDIADAALRETGKYIQDGLLKHDRGLGTNIMDHVYHEGGGKFKVMLPPNYPAEDIQAVAAYVNEQMDTHMRKVAIVDFAKATYANPSHGREAESAQKISLLEDRLGKLSKGGKPLQLMADIPHPKDSSKSLSFKHFIMDVGVDSVAGLEGSIDRNKVAVALEALTAKSEIQFSKPAGEMKRTGS